MQKPQQTLPRAKNWIIYSGLVALFASLLALLFIYKPHFRGTFFEENLEWSWFRKDDEVLRLFADYDINRDGHIDVEEFAPVANKLLLGKNVKVAEAWDYSGENLTLKASFTPLGLSSMSKFAKHQPDGNDIQLGGLKSWQAAAEPVSRFPISAFSALFLPPEDLNVEPGQTWYLVKPEMSKHGPGLSNERYFPPMVHDKAALLHHLLAMFHPRPFLLTRFGPQGSIACIRAQNEYYLEIAFRIHAEFQLNKPPLLPFWFTPAQFSGSVVIRRDGTHISSFHMAVPNNRSLNVDMEWLVNDRWVIPDVLDDKTEDKSMETQEAMEPHIGNEVDIGFLPQMELQSTGPSSVNHNKESEDTDEVPSQMPQSRDTSAMDWDTQITWEKAQEIIQQKFYPFKKVPYLKFEDVFERAQQEHKLVHHILLWGALDDQSC